MAQTAAMALKVIFILSLVFSIKRNTADNTETVFISGVYWC